MKTLQLYGIVQCSCMIIVRKFSFIVEDKYKKIFSTNIDLFYDFIRIARGFLTITSTLLHEYVVTYFSPPFFNFLSVKPICSLLRDQNFTIILYLWRQILIKLRKYLLCWRFVRLMTSFLNFLEILKDLTKSLCIYCDRFM